jgi:hypothetical protein
VLCVYSPQAGMGKSYFIQQRIRELNLKHTISIPVYGDFTHKKFITQFKEKLRLNKLSPEMLQRASLALHLTIYECTSNLNQFLIELLYFGQINFKNE